MKQDLMIEEITVAGFAFLDLIYCVFSAWGHEKENEEERKLQEHFHPGSKKSNFYGGGQWCFLCTDISSIKTVSPPNPTKNIPVLRT